MSKQIEINHYEFGVNHRIDGPAKIILNEQNKVGVEQYYLFGRHIEDVQQYQKLINFFDLAAKNFTKLVFDYFVNQFQQNLSNNNMKKLYDETEFYFYFTKELR